MRCGQELGNWQEPTHAPARLRCHTRCLVSSGLLLLVLLLLLLLLPSCRCRRLATCLRGNFPPAAAAAAAAVACAGVARGCRRQDGASRPSLQQLPDARILLVMRKACIVLCAAWQLVCRSWAIKWFRFGMGQMSASDLQPFENLGSFCFER